MHAADYIVYGLGLLVAAGIVTMLVVAVVTSPREARRQREALDSVARARLEGATVDHEARSATGRVGGHPVTIRYTSTRTSKTTHSMTEVEVGTARTPLQLELGPTRKGSAAAVRDGLLVDVSTGDRSFDDRFLVQGAPADVVRALLDAELRASLLGRGTLTLSTRAGGRCVVVVPGRPAEADLLALVDLAALLGRRVATAYPEADRAALDQRGGPYRGEPDARSAPALNSARAADLARLADVNQRRGGRQRRVALLLAGGLLLLVIGIALIGQATGRR